MVLSHLQACTCGGPRSVPDLCLVVGRHQLPVLQGQASSPHCTGEELRPRETALLRYWRGWIANEKKKKIPDPDPLKRQTSIFHPDLCGERW